MPNYSSVEVRARVVTLWESGLSYREIADQINLSKSQVHYWITRWRTENEDTALKTKRKPGPNFKITGMENRK
ncbi:hypothetical protein QE152_g1226 [Popillia japonica]|uniref:Transposase n=1 Tax=Popillia japonica TaxID=7064 RepID=A0AAW1N9C2_POPJA